MDKGHRVSVVCLVFTCLLGAFSLPLISFSWTVLKTWAQFRLRAEQVFYVEHWFDSVVLILTLAAPLVLICAAIGVLAAVHPRWPRWSALIAFPVGILIALFAAVVIPDVPLWHSELIQNLNHLESIESGLKAWDGIHGTFPLTTDELRGAIQGTSTAVSVYGRGREHLVYQIEFIPNQSQPYVVDPNRPGIVYYAVNQNGTQFWLTASGLNAPFGDRPTMVRAAPLVASKQPWGDLLVSTATHR